jgi:hypothetical protein
MRIFVATDLFMTSCLTFIKMILYNTYLDILKYTVAGIGVVYIAFYLFKPYLDKGQSLQHAGV